MINLFNKKYKIVDENPYDKKPLSYKGLVIKGEWKEKYSMLIVKENIKAIFLNYSLGWQCSDYGFLEEIPKIQEIDIIDTDSKGIKSIEYQDELEDIGLNVPDPYSIDFSVFSKLTKLFIYCRKKNDSLYKCISLQDLYIDEFKLGDRHSLGQLSSLRKLTIANANIKCLDFLKELHSLEQLAFYNCKSIESFSSLSSLKRLKRLEIQGTKNIGDVSFLKNLINLEVLLIDAGAVDSIVPLNSLKKLQALSIYGTNSLIKDGNLEPINNLKNLSILDIPNKHFYNYKVNNYWNWDDLGKTREEWLLKK